MHGAVLCVTNCIYRFTPKTACVPTTFEKDPGLCYVLTCNAFCIVVEAVFIYISIYFFVYRPYLLY